MDINIKNKIIFLTLGIILIVLLSYILKNWILKKSGLKTAQNKKIEVVTSFYPLYFFTSEIGKDNINIINLTPAGAEPHDFEPNTKDLVKIEKSDLLIINGANLEPYGDKLKSDLKSSHTKVVAVAEGLASQEIEEEGKKIVDPHVWLDPILAQRAVERIETVLIEIDPLHGSDYETNSKNLVARLNNLDQSFQQALKTCKQKDIVTSHAAFGYLASRYNLNQVSLTGLSPDQEPSPQDLVNIASFAKRNKIKYIFFETLVSSRLADTIAREVGAKTLVFNPLEGLTKEEQSEGKDYFNLQQQNLENLKIALECQ